jgi:hypothetical protein
MNEDSNIVQETATPVGTPVRQISVFLQNRVGSLMALVKLLGDHSIEVLGLSVQESTELTLVRLILSDPESTETLFIEKGIPHSVVPIVVVEIREDRCNLAECLAALLAAEINIHFSYALLTRPRGHSVLVLHVEDSEIASNVLVSSGFRMLMQGDLSR